MALDDLMRFRTAYLRSIALSWADESFRTELVSGTAVDVMKRYLGFDWPWPKACTLKFKSAPNFQWICNDWIWPLHLTDHLTLYVPLDPESAEIPREHRAMALADFYQQRSALFSDGWGADWGDAGDSTGSPPVPTSQLPVEGSAPPAGGFYPAAGEFAAFQVALLAAIARSWDDKEFKALLTIDAVAALQTVRGYVLPWTMTLAIADDEGARWHPPIYIGHMSPPRPSHWTFSKPNELILNLPSKPSELQSEPVALAMYNGTGAAYPFSCTC